MIKLDEHIRKMLDVTDELSKCKRGTPHFKDKRRQLNRLKAEYCEAVRNLHDSERISKAN